MLISINASCKIMILKRKGGQMRAPKRESTLQGKCARCKKPYTRFAPAQKYCDECKPKRYKPVTRTNKKCAHCGTEFKGYPRKRFCSSTCRTEFWQQVFAAGKAAVEASRIQPPSSALANEAKKRRKTK